MYPLAGFDNASASVIGFQSASENVCSGQLPLDGSRTAAKEDVITTLLTDGALSLTACRIPVVPMIAGSRRSCISVRLGPRHSRSVPNLLYIFDIEGKGASCVNNSLKRRC